MHTSFCWVENNLAANTSKTGLHKPTLTPNQILFAKGSESGFFNEVSCDKQCSKKGLGGAPLPQLPLTSPPPG